MQLRRDRSVEDGFEIALDRGQRGAEVMGNIGNEIPLVFFHVLELRGHVVQSVTEIADLVMPVDGLDLVVEMPGRVFPGRKGDVPERDIYIEGKNDQDDHGKQENDECCQIYNI